MVTTMKTQTDVMHESGYLTAAEAAEALAKASVSTVHRMAKHGKLAYKRVDVHWYISAKSVLDVVRGTPLEENAKVVLARCGVQTEAA